MKSEHDHWGEMRALRKKMKRAIRAHDPDERARLWQRYRTISWALELGFDTKWRAVDARRAKDQREAAERRLARASWSVRWGSPKDQ